LLVAAGILIAVLGILVWAGGLSWFGRFPVTPNRSRKRSLYFPVVSMLLVSVVASVLPTILQYLFRR
jgi:hypothetical protein